MRFLKFTAQIIVVFLLFAAPAHAKWHVAESDNFVIYANDSEKDLTKFSDYLERYHQALEIMMMRDLPVPSPSNRVTIYVVGGESELKSLYGGDNRYVAGFYVPRAGGSKAFVQNVVFKGGTLDFSLQILLHEYAHHFRISTSRYSLPLWWNEGEAEFYSSAKFESDGGISIGRPNNNRAGELFSARDVSIRELLDEELYRKKQSNSYDAFYGKAWLLYHYLYFAETRKGQFEKYARAIVEGTPALVAAEGVFGDLQKLDRELDVYQKRLTMSAWTIKPAAFKPVPTAIRPLSEGEAAMMKVVMRSKRGVDEEEAAKLVIDARKIAALYPGDAGVLTALAEAEFDSGNDDAAIAAADKAISIDKMRKDAYVQKGYALFRKAAKAPDADAAYKAAMAPFNALNKLENDHPLPLIYYYRSYTERGKREEDMPETVRHALERAAELSPFDQELWLNVADMLLDEKKFDLAINALEPIANTAHRSGTSNQAARMIKRIKKIQDGTATNIYTSDEVEEADTPGA